MNSVEATRETSGSCVSMWGSRDAAIGVRGQHKLLKLRGVEDGGELREEFVADRGWGL